MERLRIDKWLWAARFFKTRSLAGRALGNGQVRLNGLRIKPARAVSPGDEVRIEKGDEVFIVTVLDLDARRRSASDARLLYQESAESEAARELQRQRSRDERLVSHGLRGTGRPNKRQRRQIIRFQSGKPEE